MTPHRGRAGLVGTPLTALVAALLGACADTGSSAQREMQSLQARMRMGVGDLGTRQDEATARETAPPADARQHRLGDRFLYSDGSIEVVAGVEGMTVTWDEGGGQSRTATVNPAFPYFTRTTDRYDRVAEIGGDPPEGLWPLGGQAVQGYNAVVSRTERATDEARQFRSRHECAAQSPTTIDTPLGAYSALPVECRTFSGQRLSPRGTERFDMVPALGHFVRRVETDQRGVVESEVFLTGIEPGSWLGDAARRRLGEILRSVLEKQASGEVAPFVFPKSKLSGYVMATATFADPATPGRFCRAYSITIADTAGIATEYPGTSCREDGRWTLPQGF